MGKYQQWIITNLTLKARESISHNAESKYTDSLVTSCSDPFNILSPNPLNLYKKPNHCQGNSLWDRFAASCEKMRQYYDRGVIVPLRASSAPRSLKEKNDREIVKCVSAPDMVGLLGLGRVEGQGSIDDIRNRGPGGPCMGGRPEKRDISWLQFRSGWWLLIVPAAL